MIVGSFDWLVAGRTTLTAAVDSWGETALLVSWDEVLERFVAVFADFVLFLRPPASLADSGSPSGSDLDSDSIVNYTGALSAGPEEESSNSDSESDDDSEPSSVTAILMAASASIEVGGAKPEEELAETTSEKQADLAHA